MQCSAVHCIGVCGVPRSAVQRSAVIALYGVWCALIPLLLFSQDLAISTPTVADFDNDGWNDVIVVTTGGYGTVL